MRNPLCCPHCVQLDHDIIEVSCQTRQSDCMMHHLKIQPGYCEDPNPNGIMAMNKRGCGIAVLLFCISSRDLYPLFFDREICEN